MKLNDLRAELDRQADQIDGIGDLPLRAIRRKAAGIRRRQIATVAVVVSLVAAVPPALDGVSERSQSPTVGTSDPPTPSLGDIIGQPLPTTTSQWSRPRDVVKGDVRFPGAIGGDRLLKAAVGGTGQRSVGVALDPPTGETEIRPVCVLPDGAEHAASRYRLEVLVNRRLEMTSPCGVDQGMKAVGQHWSYPVAGGQPGVNAPAVMAGGPVQVSARLIYTGPGQPSRQARIGIGIYRLGGFQVVERTGRGLRIPKVVAYGGASYRLVGVRSARAIDGAKLNLGTPAGIPFLVLTGGIEHTQPSTRPRNGVRTIRLTGVGETAVRASRYPADQAVLPELTPRAFTARPAARASATYAGPNEPNFVHLLAVYRLNR